jgi:hypothetical protein
MARTIMLLAARRSCKGGMTIPEGLLDIHLMITKVAGCSQQFAWFAAFCQFYCCCLWHAVLINFLQCSPCQTWNMALVRLEGREREYISKLNKCDFVMKNNPRSSVFHVVSRRLNFTLFPLHPRIISTELLFATCCSIEGQSSMHAFLCFKDQPSDPKNRFDTKEKY